MSTATSPRYQLPEAAMVAAIVARIPDAQAVLLYGSFARDEAWPDSDVDLAVLAQRPIPAALLFDLKGDLEVSLSRDVDLVDARVIPPTLRAALIADARPIRVFDETALHDWEAQSLTAYGLFNTERRELLHAFWAGDTGPSLDQSP